MTDKINRTWGSSLVDNINDLTLVAWEAVHECVEKRKEVARLKAENARLKDRISVYEGREKEAAYCEMMQRRASAGEP